MKSSYAIIGLGALIIVAGGYYAYSRSSPEVQDTSSTLETIASTTLSVMELTSSAFANEAEIPMKYTCEGEDVSPPLSIENVPAGTQSLTLIMHDIDIQKNLRADGTFDHWIMFNIIPTTKTIAEGEVPGIEGKNGTGRIGFMGSCPPKQYEPPRHRYVFTLYALKTELPLMEGATKAEVLEAMEGNILAQAELTGTYEKQNE